MANKTTKRKDTAEAEASETEARELMEAVKRERTLDEYLNRNPKTLSDADIDAMVLIERQKRAIFIAKDAEKRGGVVLSREPKNAKQEQNDAEVAD